MLSLQQYGSVVPSRRSGATTLIQQAASSSSFVVPTIEDSLSATRLLWRCVYSQPDTPSASSREQSRNSRREASRSLSSDKAADRLDRRAASASSSGPAETLSAHHGDYLRRLKANECTIQTPLGHRARNSRNAGRSDNDGASLSSQGAQSINGSSDGAEIMEVKVALDSTIVVHESTKDSFQSSKISFASSKASDNARLEKMHDEGILNRFDQLRRTKSLHEISFALDLARPEVCVRNTFIHLNDVDVEEVPEKPEFVSAPSVMMTKPFSTKYPRMEPAHIRGDCRPCAYFVQKKDGCRWGEDCSFCHLCPPGALRKKKREKIKALKDSRKDKRHAKSRAFAA